MWILSRFDSPAFEATSHIVAAVEILLRNRMVRMTIEAVTAPAFEFHHGETTGTAVFRHPLRCRRYHWGYLHRTFFSQPSTYFLEAAVTEK